MKKSKCNKRESQTKFNKQNVNGRELSDFSIRIIQINNLIAHSEGTGYHHIVLIIAHKCTARKATADESHVNIQRKGKSNSMSVLAITGPRFYRVFI